MECIDKVMSVFTPTYNRAYILPRLYDSLCRQTCNRFEWLIVDDGSCDNTKEVVDEWIREDKITIRYFWQENGGKQRAYNLGVEKSDLDLFLCVDSDDFLSENCVEEILAKWEEIKYMSDIAGIIALRGDMEGKPLGTYFPENLEYTTTTELYGKYKFRGDMTMAYRTDILKQYPYWIADGEKFIGEGYVWSQIDQKYKLAIIPKLFMYGEYLPDGYTYSVRKVTKNNPKSYVVLKKQTIEFADSYWEKYLHTILCIVGCIMSGEKKPLSVVPNKILGVLAYIPAWLVWLVFYKIA